jgi:glycosyltransferase involved in cell wall biosynthesis
MQATKTPTVSICTAAYNHERFIGKAVESVLLQEVDFGVEMIIGEDCSTDGTRALCERYADQYPDLIQLLPSEKNLGMSKNGIRILHECRGKYVAILDGDDYWLDPHKLRDQVAFLEANPDYGMVYSDIQTVDDEGRLIESESVAERRPYYQEGDVFVALLQGNNFINSCTAVFRRELLELSPNPIETHWYSFDYWYWLRVSMQAKVAFLNKKTACYRIHQGGITGTKTYNKKTRERMYYILYDVLERYHRLNKSDISETEKRLVFQKMLSLLYRNYGTLGIKWNVLKHIPRYFPGIRILKDLLLSKIIPHEVSPIASKPAH